MQNGHLKRIALAALVVVLAVAVAALAGVSAANPGHGKGKAKGKTKTAAAAQYQYGSAGKQYGRHRVAVCHKGHTITIAQPAVKAHLRHHDRLGAC